MTQTPERLHQLNNGASDGSAAEPGAKALLFDYRQAANPVRPGLTEPIPYRDWSPELHASGPSAIHPLDLSSELGVSGPATSPALAAHFIRIVAGEGIRAAAQATSSLFFVLSGSTNRSPLCQAIVASCADSSARWWQRPLPERTKNSELVA